SGEVRANKVLQEYRLDGTLEAGPGAYTLKIGPVTRDFTVTRGTVIYFGTPDLNAELDIRAEHVVRTAEGEIPIIANISGTLLQPRLTLTSTNQWQGLAEVDLVSYLMFGVPSSQAALLGRGSGELTAAAGYFTSAFTAELERALITDLGLPVDLIEIRPAIIGGAGRTGLEVTQLVVGWQLGSKVFFTVNAGICGRQVGTFGTENLGAALQLRFSGEWRSQLSLEPTFQGCRLQGTPQNFGSTSPYQIGTDLIYETEF
ncbi:MAG: translocation/assembly module TamB, partial [Gemmatimonadota bacterium]|nr:translocation/assembly module TamB [Gemmatimonadota bacterium]